MEKTINPNSLCTMLEGQKDLLGHYIKIEGLPNYPIDIQDKRGQKVLRACVDRMIEEMSEAFTELKEVHNLAAVNQVREARKALIAYNEELGDAHHFFLEFLLFAGITDDNSGELCQQIINDHDHFVGFYKEDRTWKFMLNVGGFINQQQNRSTVNIIKPDRFIIATEDEALENPLMSAGRRISQDLLAEHGEALWDVVHYGKLATNLLKNRDWNQTDRMVNGAKFQHAVAYFALAWATYLQFAGVGEIALVNIFKHCYEKNLDRIKADY